MKRERPRASVVNDRMTAEEREEPFQNKNVGSQRMTILCLADNICIITLCDSDLNLLFRL